MKNTYFCLICVFYFLCIFIKNNAHAAMYVYPMEVSIGTNGISQIKLISQDDSVQFIKVTLKQVLKPGTSQEREVTTDGAHSTVLVITPKKIALAAGSQRIVRLVSVIPPEKETTWRAYFESINEENFLSSKEFKNKKEKSAANIGVNIIWGALIHVAPNKITQSLTLNAFNGNIINNGSIRIPIKELGICNHNDVCKWKKANITVYPNTEVNIPNIKFSYNEKYKVKYLNWITKKMEEISIPIFLG